MNVARLTAALVVIAAAVAIAAPAQAAEYVVESCRDAAGNELSTAAWIPAGDPDRRFDTCDEGGALGIVAASSDVAPRLAISGYRFDVPRGATLVEYEAWLAAKVRNGTPFAWYMAGLGQGDELAVPTTLAGCFEMKWHCSEGDFAVPLSPANEIAQPVDEGGLALLIACASPVGLPCVPGADPPARTSLFRSVVTLDDPSDPAIGSLGGTLLGGGPASGVRTLTATVTDEGSGVATVELLVDGAVAAARQAGGTCVEPYVVADPCAGIFPATFSVDTTQLAQGAHTVALRASDGAGNVSQSAPVGIVVDNPAPAPPPVVVVPGPAPPAPPPIVIVEEPSRQEEPPDPPPVTVQLRAPDEVEVPTREPVTGQVVASDGTPRAGVALRFERRPYGTRSWRRWRGGTASGPDGRFVVPAPRESTEVRVVAEDVRAEPARIRFVRPLEVTIAASDARLRNGQELTLGGRVRHTGGTEDLTVLVQSFVRGRWRTVDSTESGQRGRIRWSYRFENTSRTARYRFRFVVRSGPGLPWKRTVSDVVSVVVAGG